MVISVFLENVEIEALWMEEISTFENRAFYIMDSMALLIFQFLEAKKQEDWYK